MDYSSGSVRDHERLAERDPPVSGLPGGEETEALEALGSLWGQGGAGARWQGAPPAALCEVFFGGPGSSPLVEGLGQNPGPRGRSAAWLSRQNNSTIGLGSEHSKERTK